jgi:hypothetical protein
VKLHDEKLPQFSQIILNVTKSNRTREAWPVSSMEEITNAYKILVGKLI